jgi:hypothetical protein
MKLAALLALAIALSFGQTAFAQKDTWGLGLRFGSPTAFTAKRYIGTKNALDINVGNGPFAVYDNNYGPYRNNGFSVMINYLWRKPVTDAQGLEFYYGIGGMLSARSYYYDNKNQYRTRGGLGVTGALGLEYFIPKAPIALFAEVNPYLEVFPAPFWINLGAGIGGRYIF